MGEHYQTKINALIAVIVAGLTGVTGIGIGALAWRIGQPVASWAVFIAGAVIGTVAVRAVLRWLREQAGV